MPESQRHSDLEPNRRDRSRLETLQGMTNCLDRRRTRRLASVLRTSFSDRWKPATSRVAPGAVAGCPASCGPQMESAACREKGLWGVSLVRQVADDHGYRFGNSRATISGSCNEHCVSSSTGPARRRSRRYGIQAALVLANTSFTSLWRMNQTSLRNFLPRGSEPHPIIAPTRIVVAVAIDDKDSPVRLTTRGRYGVRGE